MANDQQHLDITVRGQVQGVFFRVSAKRKANELGITGFARNQPDGSVYIEAEGTDAAMRQFIAWCQDGPDWAQVAEIETSEAPLQFFTTFTIE